MRLDRKNGFALFLIGCGVLILLDRLGLGLDNILGFLFPFALIFFGYIGIKNNRNLIGWGLIIFGIIILVGKLTGLIGWLIAGGLIVYGIYMLKEYKATN